MRLVGLLTPNTHTRLSIFTRSYVRMPDLTAAPPTLGKSSGKMQSQRGGRGRFNPSGRPQHNNNNRNNARAGGQDPNGANPQHPGHIPGSLASRPLNGIFAIDKPSGRTSMSLLEDLKLLMAFSPLFRNPDGSIPEGHGGKAWQPKENWSKKYKKSSAPPKIGQGGTLDPLASGVLVIGIGNGTKQLQSYLDCAKTYKSVGLLGSSTTSYDSQDPIMTRTEHTHVTPELITELLPYFTGPLMQYPPLYSAVKMDGRKLFDYARNNIPLPRPIEPREIEVTKLELLDWFTPDQHQFKGSQTELPEEEKKLVGRVKEMVGQKEGQGDTVVHIDENVLAQSQPAQQQAEQAHAAEHSEQPEQPEQPKTSEQCEQPVITAETADAHADQSPEQTAAEPSAGSSSEQQPPSSSSSPCAFRLGMTVSSGTYVRSIIHDVGLACNSSAHVVELRRTRQGEWFTHDEPQPAAAEGEEEQQKPNVIEWELFDDALQELKREANPNSIKGNDGKDRQLREWEQRLLDAIRPV
ncbi:unnamed protein product [Sympodiomycopsis kandeliae]